MVKIAAAGLATLALSTGASNANQSNVLFVLDSSNSMIGKVDGTPKYQIARKAMIGFVNEMHATTKMGLVSFGHRFNHKIKECQHDMELLRSVGDLVPTDVREAVGYVRPKGQTPIAATLAEVPRWLAKHRGQSNTVVLVSDGVESCNGDPCAVAKRLHEQGIATKIHVVGFGLSSKQRAKLQCISDNGDGKYFDAKDEEALVAAFDRVKVEIKKPEPTKPKQAIYFKDEFSGAELAEHWEVANPNPEQYVVENGDLLLLGKEVGGISKPTIPNIVKLKKALPAGNWTITVEFTPDFKTSKDVFSAGLFTDNKNHIAATLFGNTSFCCDVGSRANAVVLQNAKVSGGAATKFEKPIGRPHSSHSQSFVQYVKSRNINVRSLLQIVKTGRSYRTRFHHMKNVDQNGNPIWVESEKVTSLRAPRTFFMNTSQWDKNDGESLFHIHSVKIEQNK